MKGYIQVYTGNGKGKTTAALGLALRAAGAGLKVFIAQFLKKGAYSEIQALERFAELITIRQYGLERFVRGRPAEADREAVRRGLAEVQEVINTRQPDLVILEEANVAVACGAMELKDLLHLIDNKPEGLELVITGRGAAEEVIAKADLVTEMQPVKHYFEQGVRARKGIEL